MDDRYVSFEIAKTKHIALVAHDGKKKEIVDWCDRNKDILKNHFLCGTGTTAREDRASGESLQQWSVRRRPADRCQDRRRTD